eukprot:3962503-Pyramimonas_sp.AAC.1
MYIADIPGRVRGHAQQPCMRTTFKLVYDSIAEEVDLSPSLQRALEFGDFSDDSPMSTRCYGCHVHTDECLNATGKYPIPLAVYLDGVRYTPLGAGKTDNILQISVVNMLTKKRHLFSATRTNDMCACGCKGHCTVHSLLSVLAWQLEAMVRGRSPAARHSGEPWTEEEVAHSMRAHPCHPPPPSTTNKIIITFVPCGVGLWRRQANVLCDWAEFNKTFSLASWASQYAPCPMCIVPKEGFGEAFPGMISNGALGWVLRSTDDYEFECVQNEITVDVTSN